jgi:hypothetical protein
VCPQLARTAKTVLPPTTIDFGKNDLMFPCSLFVRAGICGALREIVTHFRLR